MIQCINYKRLNNSPRISGLINIKVCVPSKRRDLCLRYLIHAKTIIFNYKKIQIVEEGTSELNSCKNLITSFGKSSSSTWLRKSFTINDFPGVQELRNMEVSFKQRMKMASTKLLEFFSCAILVGQVKKWFNDQKCPLNPWKLLTKPLQN